VHALFAHVRERGKEFQIDLGVPAESIKGEGNQTHSDLIIMALAKKAGWLLERKQDEPDDEGTKAQKVASMFPERRKGRGPGPEQRQFMSLELARLKAHDDALPQSERRTRQQQMAETAHSWKAQLKPAAPASTVAPVPAPASATASPPVPRAPPELLPEWEKYVGTYTAALEGTEHQPTGQPWTAAECAALSVRLLPLYGSMRQPTVEVGSRPSSAYNDDLGVTWEWSWLPP
jgi:hypothetical protein